MANLFSKSFLIFGVIGVLNTVIDVSLFVSLENAGLPILAANTISTSIALGVSFVLNGRFTFGKRDMTRRRAGHFLLFTLSGLWILQPIIIGLSLLVLDNVSFIHTAMAYFVSDPARFDTTVAKLASLPVTLLWNYFWYRAVVFKQTT